MNMANENEDDDCILISESDDDRNAEKPASGISIADAADGVEKRDSEVMCDDVKAECKVGVQTSDTAVQSRKAANINPPSRSQSSSKHEQFVHVNPMQALGLGPHMGSGVQRIDLIRFLAECRKRRLNQALYVLLSYPRFLLSVLVLL